MEQGRPAPARGAGDLGRDRCRLERSPGIVVHSGDGADPIILKGSAEEVTARLPRLPTSRHDMGGRNLCEPDGLGPLRDG